MTDRTKEIIEGIRVLSELQEKEQLIVYRELQQLVNDLMNEYRQ